MRLKDELLQQLFEYKDPVSKVMKRQWWGCKVISVVNKPTGRNPIALLKVTWEPMDHLGWSSSTENAQFDTRLWNDDAQLFSWRFKVDESNDHAMSSPSTNDIKADLSSVMDRGKDLPMMQVPVGDLYTGAAMTFAHRQR